MTNVARIGVVPLGHGLRATLTRKVGRYDFAVCAQCCRHIDLLDAQAAAREGRELRHACGRVLVAGVSKTQVRRDGATTSRESA